MKLYRNIMTGPLALPKHLSSNARSLIVGLLNRNPDKRLGGREGAEEVKSHPWFSDIDWTVASSKGLKPPKPKVKEMKAELVGLELFDSEHSELNRVGGWEFVNSDAA